MGGERDGVRRGSPPGRRLRPGAHRPLQDRQHGHPVVPAPAPGGPGPARRPVPGSERAAVPRGVGAGRPRPAGEGPGSRPRVGRPGGRGPGVDRVEGLPEQRELLECHHRAGSPPGRRPRARQGAHVGRRTPARPVASVLLAAAAPDYARPEVVRRVAAGGARRRAATGTRDNVLEPPRSGAAAGAMAGLAPRPTRSRSWWPTSPTGRSRCASSSGCWGCPRVC